jgi:hypothetical protein
MKKFLIFFIFLIGCDVTSYSENNLEVDIFLNSKSPKDFNGYYHIKLDSTRNQTIHLINGKIINQIRPTKIDWYSNLHWYLNGEKVPTVNPASYSNDNGEVFVTIAPIYSMKGDTLIITSRITETQITKTIKFVLE